jgi:hypothetical protein
VPDPVTISPGKRVVSSTFSRTGAEVPRITVAPANDPYYKINLTDSGYLILGYKWLCMVIANSFQTAMEVAMCRLQQLTGDLTTRKSKI